MRAQGCGYCFADMANAAEKARIHSQCHQTCFTTTLTRSSMLPQVIWCKEEHDHQEGPGLRILLRRHGERCRGQSTHKHQTKTLESSGKGAARPSWVCVS
jgi:hypothetical protein